jgi:ABC-type Fe3+-hydroxamate transport system substrate-binding protein
MELIYYDQMNQTIRLEATPRRIVSLVPSQTELLYDLGLAEEVVGITKFCVHPHEWYTRKNRIGGTKQLNIEKIKSLQPDLIIGNKEENTIQDIVALQKIAPVWMSDIKCYDDALSMIRSVGEIVGKKKESDKLVTKIEASFQTVKGLFKNKTVLYYIWDNPGMVAGKITFIDSILSIIGFQNICSQARYPMWDNSEAIKPNYILLSSEPYPFKQEDCIKFQKEYLDSRIVIVDGELFSWYGSRMKKAPHYFRELFHQLAN